MLGEADQAARLRRGPGLPSAEQLRGLDSPALLPGRGPSATKSTSASTTGRSKKPPRASSSSSPAATGSTTGPTRPDGLSASPESTEPAESAPTGSDALQAPRISAFWNAGLHEGKGGWDWTKIRETWLNLSLKSGRELPLVTFAQDISISARMLQAKAKEERWKPQLRYRMTNEAGALPVETGEDWNAQLLRMKNEAVRLCEKLMDKVRPMIASPKIKIGAAKQAVLVLKEIVEITRAEARAPENRSRKELAFKGLLVPGPFAEPGADQHQFILDQMPGAALPPGRRPASGSTGPATRPAPSRPGSAAGPAAGRAAAGSAARRAAIATGAGSGGGGTGRGAR